MSLNNRFQDLLISILDLVEADGGKKRKLIIATLGIVATFSMWLLHRHYPSYLFKSHGELSVLVIVVVLAPPFVTTLSVCQLLFPSDLISGKMKPGLLTAHIQREQANKRWKIMIAAGVVSAINLLLMILLVRSE